MAQFVRSGNPYSTRHRMPIVATAALLLANFAGYTVAADYPTKPVRLIVPFPPGGLTDIQVRLVAQKASQRLGRQVVVDNRPGAEGRIGVELIAKAPADGHTIGLGTIGTLVIAPLIYAKVAYDPATAFAPIARLTTIPYLVVVHSSVPGTTLKEFIEHAKSRPGQLNFAASSAVGKLVLEMFNTSAGVSIVHVPYQGVVAAATDLVAGRVQLMIEGLPAFRQDIQSGKLKALAVTDTKRYAQLPNVPTTAEAGLSGCEVTAWFGLIAPKATPAPIVLLWNGEANNALAQKDVRDSLYNQGFEPTGGTPQAFAAHISAERSKWSRVVSASGLKFD